MNSLEAVGKGGGGIQMYWSQVWVKMGAHQTDISSNPGDIHNSSPF